MSRRVKQACIYSRKLDRPKFVDHRPGSLFIGRLLLFSHLVRAKQHLSCLYSLTKPRLLFSYFASLAKLYIPNSIQRSESRAKKNTLFSSESVVVVVVVAEVDKLSLKAGSELESGAGLDAEAELEGGLGPGGKWNS